MLLSFVGCLEDIEVAFLLSGDMTRVVDRTEMKH
jgi:hypothetical protein